MKNTDNRIIISRNCPSKIGLLGMLVIKPFDVGSSDGLGLPEPENPTGFGPFFDSRKSENLKALNPSPKLNLGNTPDQTRNSICN